MLASTGYRGCGLRGGFGIDIACGINGPHSDCAKSQKFGAREAGHTDDPPIGWLFAKRTVPRNYDNLVTPMERRRNAFRTANKKQPPNQGCCEKGRRYSGQAIGPSFRIPSWPVSESTLA